MSELDRKPGVGVGRGREMQSAVLQTGLWTYPLVPLKHCGLRLQTLMSTINDNHGTSS